MSASLSLTSRSGLLRIRLFFGLFFLDLTVRGIGRDPQWRGLLWRRSMGLMVEVYPHVNSHLCYSETAHHIVVRKHAPHVDAYILSPLTHLNGCGGWTLAFHPFRLLGWRGSPRITEYRG